MSKVDWQPMESAPWDRYVLVACESGYTTIDWIYRIARRHSDGYHNGRWDDEANDALKDCGHVPSFWDELPNPPKETEQ